MSRLLDGLDGVLCHSDDVLVYGSTQEEHNRRLLAVLERVKEAGVTLKSKKCEINKQSVKFLGCVIDSQGIQSDPDKMKLPF